MSLSTKAMLACLLGSLAILPTVAFAHSPATAKSDPRTQSQTEEKRKTLMADATSAIQETQAALKHLDEGKTKEALAAAAKKDRTKDDNERLKAAMDEARGQLEFAQALGYGAKKDFDKMYRQLTEIREKTADNGFGTDFFAKIKASIAAFLKSSQPKNG